MKLKYFFFLVLHVLTVSSFSHTAPSSPAENHTHTHDNVTFANKTVTDSENTTMNNTTNTAMNTTMNTAMNTTMNATNTTMDEVEEFPFVWIWAASGALLGVLLLYSAPRLFSITVEEEK